MAVKRETCSSSIGLFLFLRDHLWAEFMSQDKNKLKFAKSATHMRSCIHTHRTSQTFYVLTPRTRTGAAKRWGNYCEATVCWSHLIITMSINLKTYFTAMLVTWLLTLLACQSIQQFGQINISSI